MAIQLQLRRGTSAENNVFTGAVGELTMDTDTNGLRIHDGTTIGGFAVPVLVAVQRPTADNNYTWYRKWSDGWVEQGGALTTLSTAAQTITFPVAMADTSYYANANYAGGTPTTTPYAVWVDDVTTTTIRVRGTNSTAVTACKWQVCGMSAS